MSALCLGAALGHEGETLSARGSETVGEGWVSRGGLINRPGRITESSSTDWPRGASDLKRNEH